jgi:DNA repair protein SbcC/Rad50
MSKIKLLGLKFHNFKGIRDLEIDFNRDAPTTICGKNAKGKTSVFDGFTWLLFGKDSMDRKDFEIKTQNDNGKPIHKLEHSVSGRFLINDVEHTATRIYKEMWTKKRGELTAEMSGHEQLFYWDDVPMKAGEYQAKVNSIIDEGLFKLITNPMYFNNNLKWDERRRLLFAMAGVISDDNILGAIANNQNKTQIEQIIEMLKVGKTAEGFKKELNDKKKRIKADMEVIPTRIDEANRQRPDETIKPALLNEKSELEFIISELNETKENALKTDQAANQQLLDLQRQQNDRKLELQRLEFELTSEYNNRKSNVDVKVRNAKQKVRDAENYKVTAEQKIGSLQSEIISIEQQLAILRQKWTDINAEQFVKPEGKDSCPTCGTKFDQSKISDLEVTWKTNFENDKAQRLSDVKGKADSLNTTKTNISNRITEYENEKRAAISELEHAQKLLLEIEAEANAGVGPVPEPTTEIIALRNAIAEFQLPEPKSSDYSVINQQITGHQTRLNQINNELHAFTLVANVDSRIDELQKQEDDLAQQLADLEATEYTLEQFTKMKTEQLIAAVNSKFLFVKFKLFDDQINGGEREVCETLINTNGSWVEWSSANKAGQINSGVDIINALCKHNNISAPVFIDNRESVNELIFSDSQIINLVVTETDDKLRIQ